MIPFTKEEKNIIGDFVHSERIDTLIITECIELVEILDKHKLINNKDELIKKINNKSSGIVSEIKQLLMSKVSKKQGIEIMNEYYGRTAMNEAEKEEKPQYERWGVGKGATSKAFDTVLLGDEEFELIHGEFPHSRNDNTTYARNKKYPESITGFDGFRTPFKIEIEEYNYMKSSGLSGNEIRKGCSGKLYSNGQQIYECFARNHKGAYEQIKRFINEVGDMLAWNWYPKNVDSQIGKLIKYENQMFRIKSFLVEQGCMILETADGKPRKPFQHESEDVEGGYFEKETTIKIGITSNNVWWFPTEKEKKQYEKQTV